MKGVIVNYRRSRHTQTPSHVIVQAEGVDSKDKAAALVGKTVKWVAPGKGKTTLTGTIKSAHGNSGAVRVIFERGMPGQSLGKAVDIQ